MAKTHEEEKAHRTLTPDEAARRKATLEGSTPKIQPVLQSSEHGGPVEGYAQRLERSARMPSPMAIDYDRDGYPDAVVGRGQRTFTQRSRQVNTATLAQRVADNESRMGQGAVFSVGVDGHRQDQVGYRDRLRARVEAMAAVEEAGDEPVDSMTQALADMGVKSHASTGIAGGLPSGVPIPAEEVPPAQGAKRDVTPLEQAMMAPQTATTGFVNKGAAIAVPGPGVIPKKPRVPLEEGEEPPPPGPEGPFPTSHRGSFGTVPVQGTVQEDGSFVIGGVTATPPEEGKGKAKEHGKPHEPPKHEPAKHEPAKHEPPKHPEHHGKK